MAKTGDGGVIYETLQIAFDASDDSRHRFRPVPDSFYGPIIKDGPGKGCRVFPGQPCPACGRKVPMTGAQRQAAWRARNG